MGIKENFNISIFDDISNKKSGAKRCTKYIYIKNANKPEKKPSHDFFGEILINILFFPNLLPTKYAMESNIQIAEKIIRIRFLLLNPKFSEKTKIENERVRTNIFRNKFFLLLILINS
jgi:hypothetical protein